MNENEVEKCLVIDIDGVIFKQDRDDWGSGIPINGVREWLESRHEEGWYILLFSARTWDDYNITIGQLEEAGIPYDDIILGRPCAKKTIYIDDKEIYAINMVRNDSLEKAFTYSRFDEGGSMARTREKISILEGTNIKPFEVMLNEFHKEHGR